MLGHIGRFNFQKNHEFLIDVFKCVHDINSKSHLLLIGDGELREQIESKVQSLNLQNHVSLLGLRSDIPDLLQSMDCFVLPSLFEGLPYVVVEAQANGLPCFVADTISKQARILESLTFLPLDNPFTWSKHILNYSYSEKIDTRIILRESGFDEVENVRTLEKYYDSIL